MKIVAISDTHNKLNKIINTIPDGDLLIHAGDLTGRGEIWEVEKELDYLAHLNDKFKDTVIIAGNHDWLGELNPTLMKQMCDDRDITYLDNSGVEIDGVEIWGSAWTPWFYSWAFNARRTETEQKAFGGVYIKDIWDKIPEGTDILITHGPPAMILDEVTMANGDSYDPPRNVGCDELYEAIKRIKPDLHIFGHIHCNHGVLSLDGTNFHNVAICDEMYYPSNPIQVIDYEKK